MRATEHPLRKTLANICLLLASCAAGLFMCELSLRLFYPKYRDLAETPFHPEAARIWARIPNARNWWVHPDTRLPHALHHNNFGLRQHRNFSAADLSSAINVGVFGDSFVENIRMDAPYSFTEPLDWLLNQSPRRFNVLNFGVEGYGPGQSFLHHEHFRYADDLDYVFFVYVRNDLANIHATGLFDLDEAGRLVRYEARRSSWWVRFVSGLHVSYLTLDGIGRSFFRNPEASLLRERRSRRMNLAPSKMISKAGALEKSTAIFRRLVRRWKRVVEEGEGEGRFVTVLLPESLADPHIMTLLREEDVETIDLYDCFRAHDDDHLRRGWGPSPYRFRNDSHWNENGNRLAAVCLYRFLEKEMRFRRVPEDALRKALHRFYSAFGGWTPPASPKSGERAPDGLRGGDSSDGGIREKYQALGDLGAFSAFREDVRKLIQAPEKRIIRSEFDVYLDGKELVYVKDGCGETDNAGKFFLRATSIDGRNFLEEVDDSCCHFNFSMPKAMMIDEKLCVVKKVLPNYPVAHIVTGQFHSDGTLGWQAEAVIDRDAFRRALEKATAPEKLVVRSNFDVYLDGKWLIYVKDVCSPPDRRRKFFLHVTPANERDLFEVKSGFDNQDFNRIGVRVDALGCVVTRRLPSYAVRHVRTGQFVRTEEGRYKHFWEGEFSISHAADVEERRSIF